MIYINGFIDGENKIRKTEIHDLYKPVKLIIQKRIEQFNDIWESKDENKILSELVFCLFTPQSKAESCWKAVENLIEKDLIINGTEKQIVSELTGVRFCNNKAGYLTSVKKQFIIDGKLTIISKLKELTDNFEKRDWLVKNIKGYGYKEASHFLRNIGLGEDLAILDRHILKNMQEYGVISEIPKSISRKKYIELENKMNDFSARLKIPMAHLDLLFWYKQTGKIFK